MATISDVFARDCRTHPLLDFVPLLEDDFLSFGRSLDDGLTQPIIPIGAYTEEGTLLIYDGREMVEAIKLRPTMTKVLVTIQSLNEAQIAKHVFLKYKALATSKLIDEYTLSHLLVAIKKRLRCNGVELSKILGVNRTLLSKIESLRRLTPEASALVKTFTLPASLARELSTLRPDSQARLLDEIKKVGFAWKESKLLIDQHKSAKDGASGEHKSTTHLGTQTPLWDKPTTLKQYESHISLMLGAPACFLSEPSPNQPGLIEVLCFSVSELQGVADKLQNSTIPTKIRVVIEYNSNSHLDAIMPANDEY